MGRIPASVSRWAIHWGDGPMVTPDRTVAVN
jgi:hypothetical protein